MLAALGVVKLATTQRMRWPADAATISAADPAE
jgi:hypothetical protein